MYTNEIPDIPTACETILEGQELKTWQKEILNDPNLNSVITERDENGKPIAGRYPWGKDDPVNHPSHYTDGKIEVIDFIEDKQLGFHLGNAVKYISRAGKKDPSKKIQDLEKARWYLNREIERLKKEEK